MEAELSYAVLGGREVGLDAGDLRVQTGVPHLAAEGLPLLGGAVLGNEVGIGGGAGLGPDLHLIVGAGLHVQGLDEANVAVPLAGVHDVDDEGAVLQGAGGLGSVDHSFPAVGVGGFHGGEVELLQDRGFAGLLGDGQRGIGFRGGAGLVGDGVHQLIGTGGLRGGLAALEVQSGGGFHGDHGGQIPVFRVGGGDAGQGVKDLSRFHRGVLNAADGGLLVLGSGHRGLRLAAAGRHGQDHDQGQQDRDKLLHGFASFLLYLVMYRS